MKPAPKNRRSVPNVIPFGDWTVEEMESSAAIIGVSPKVAYDAAQQPLEATMGGVRPNPGIPGVQERHWVPLALATTGIDPDKEYLRRLEVPADQLMVVARMATSAGGVKPIRDALAKVMEEIKSTWENMTPEEWLVERALNWWESATPAERLALGKGQRRGVVMSKFRRGMHKKLASTFEPYSKEGYLESGYWKSVGKLVEWLDDPVNRPPPFTILTEGSSKLPFFQWSTLPGATCPGAGRCWSKDKDERGTGKSAPRSGPRGYCYSLQGWRNITPYLRQLQNTVILRLGEERATIINRELLRIQERNPTAVVRLYVDGDFDSLDTLEFWMHVCDRYPRMRFYGYSKSWDILLAYDQKHGGRWPANYLLNLSNGTFYERLDDPTNPDNPYQKILKRMQGLACTRGRFVAVVMPKGLPNGKAPKLPDDEVVQGGKKIEDPRKNPYTAERIKLHRDAVNAEAIRQGIPMTERDAKLGKFFVCPGLCGFCLGTYDGANDPEGSHACGFDAYRGKTILIAVH